jgi:hypothetical protein
MRPTDTDKWLKDDLVSLSTNSDLLARKAEVSQKSDQLEAAVRGEFNRGHAYTVDEQRINSRARSSLHLARLSEWRK